MAYKQSLKARHVSGHVEGNRTAIVQTQVDANASSNEVHWR